MLALAENNARPLLERVRFLAIFGDNLDEFFQIRVAGLKEQLAAGLTSTSPDGMTPESSSTRSAERVRLLMNRQHQIWAKSVRPRLARAGSGSWTGRTSTTPRRLHLRQDYEERVYPILTPLSVDPSHPFPYISNLSLNLAVVVRDPETAGHAVRAGEGAAELAAVPALPDGERFVPLEQVIAANIETLFPGMEIVAVHPFRVTRDADLELEIDEAEDLLAPIESILRQRERSPEAVRLEVRGRCPSAMRDAARGGARASEPADVYVARSLLGLADLFQLTKLDRPDLQYEPWTGTTQRRLQPAATGRTDIFAVLGEGDVLVQHPYDAFDTSVELFVEQAARDPAVLAIKQTLYRTSGKDSASCAPSSAPPRRASRWWRSSSSPRGSTRRRTSRGRACWSRRASTSCTAWSG